MHNCSCKVNKDVIETNEKHRCSMHLRSTRLELKHISNTKAQVSFAFVNTNYTYTTFIHMIRQAEIVIFIKDEVETVKNH